jgi:O-acetyl-ADP-ribose deacetylase (regulator of RNase III)
MKPHFTNTDNPIDFPKSYLKSAKGDLLAMAEQGMFSIIMHGCNCHNTMGSGIARQIRETYPQAYDADCLTTAGDRTKLGTITVSLADNKVGGKFVIVNAYTQYNFNRGGVLNDVFEYDAFQNILNGFARDAGPNMQIGLPYIGMGLAGGDAGRIIGMIEKFAEQVSAKGGTVTLVEFG